MTEKDAVLAANAAYYRAFAAGDFDLMSRIWAAEDVSCIHPGWPVLIGRREVLDSYAAILANPRQEALAYLGETVLLAEREARVFCIETVAGLRLAATNWFHRSDDGWRMIHHQASPISTPPAKPEPSAGRRLN